MSKEFKVGVQLLEVTNDKVVFQVDVEPFSDGRGTLNLSAISELKPVLDRLEIDGVHLDPDNLHLDARTK